MPADNKKYQKNPKNKPEYFCQWLKNFRKLWKWIDLHVRTRLWWSEKSILFEGYVYGNIRTLESTLDCFASPWNSVKLHHLTLKWASNPDLSWLHYIQLISNLNILKPFQIPTLTNDMPYNVCEVYPSSDAISNEGCPV